MNNKPSQLKSIFALTKASLKSLFRNASTLVFGFLFPFIFIAIFGLVGNGGVNVEVAFTKDTSKDNPIYKTLEELDGVKIKKYDTTEEMNDDLSKGRIAAVIDIAEAKTLPPQYTVKLTTTEADPQSGGIVKSIMQNITSQINTKANPVEKEFVKLKTETIKGRAYKTIDFVLPGQLGFALLSSGIFSTAFLILKLRETLVLKRFFATPMKRGSILISEGISRLINSTLQAIVIIGAGALIFDFTLVHGFVTFVQMVLLAMLGLIVFLGFGFIVSSIAKDENAVAPLANLFTLPQFLLAGTFFPIDNFPKWLQPISRILPLTHLNDAMRLVAFEGASFSAIWKDIAVLLIWGIVTYAIAIKIFRWESN